MRKLLLFFLLIFAVACSDKPKFTEKIIEKSPENCEEDCPSINLNYLICKRPNKFAENFNREIESQVVNFLLSNQIDSLRNTDMTIDESLEAFIKDYDNLHQYFPNISAYELILNDSISFQNEKMLSVVSNRYSYVGGAHGIASKVFLNFDISNGELIEKEDLFTDFSQVLKVAENHFKEEQNILVDSLNEKGFWFEDDKFHFPENVGIVGEHLILYYNPYEIAPYAEGIFELRIPIEEVKKYLKY
ncbi:hypothetical protein CAPN001_15230 [Capnocytophaga stomatis]|uniref:DUF3298/DUF4163 domain-containing protein n=1 Tax=Capnocytophaga stomatis TaxID=1848904 RepID=A0A250FUX1_9FLAO|nr:DUF3298 and DUF4163 domain-containing protein [Capnocytophaga stomatis]ATA88854.1 hypothetical protein CGC58_03405 [Capnocytophaga stomatis]GIJ96954.1 hypothetical protein CAPN001_15230 [Capnocytophaga stomatis]